MSIAGIGGLGAGNASQMLAALLSRLDLQPGSSSPADASSLAAPAQDVRTGQAITGNAKPSLSSIVLGALIGEQAQATDGSSGPSASSQDPVQSLFAAMDTDGDGTVSQTEMEAYIQNKGGTQTEADNLFSSLTQNGTTSLTESQLASQAQPLSFGGEGVSGHHGHHHHHHHQTSSSTDGADALMQALDTNGNGTVDQSELQSFVTANGGTAGEANSIFASLDTANAGSIGSADFANAIEKLQSNVGAGSYSPLMMMLNAFADNQPNAGTLSLSA